MKRSLNDDVLLIREIFFQIKQIVYWERYRVKYGNTVIRMANQKKLFIAQLLDRNKLDFSIIC